MHAGTANKTISSKFQLLLQAMSYGTQTFVAQTELKVKSACHCYNTVLH